MTCAQCGMETRKSTEYHPYEACILFGTMRNGDHVRAALKRIADQYTDDIRKLQPPSTTERNHNRSE